MEDEPFKIDLIDSIQNDTIKKLTERDAIKNQTQSEEQKKKFFYETIHIQLRYGKRLTNEDNNDEKEENKNEKVKEWRIQRIRLTIAFLQQLVDRLLHSTHESGATVAYLKESQTREIIIPNEMQKLCRSGSSCSYELFLSLPNKTKDVMTRNKKCKVGYYLGQMKFVLHNVPIYSQNSMHEVKKNHVQNWITDGILREDPTVRQKENSYSGIKESLENIVRRMARVPDELMLDERGRTLTGKKALLKREEKFSLLQREKDKLIFQQDEALDSLQETMSKVVDKICLSIVQHEDRTCWEFMFTGQHREYFDNIVVNKINWNTSFMYADSRIGLLQANDYSDPSSEYLVDTGAIIIERLEDGFGCFHKRAPDLEHEIRNHNSHVHVYHGTYRNGNKSGFGILHSSAGIYGGEMEKDQPNGYGTTVSKDGDVIRGQFSIHTFGNRPNRYSRSLPTGQNEIQFSDGAYYKGQMVSGEISGSGIFISSQGERLEGEFIKGVLVEGVRIRSGDVLRGKFRNGSLDGEGFFECKVKRSIYKGSFVDGLKHGVGEEVFYDKGGSVLCKYKGMYCNERRSGLGGLEFRDSGFNDDSKDNLRLKGYWLAGQPKSGGSVSKDTSEVPTTQNPLSRFRWLYRLKRVEDKKESFVGERYQRMEKAEYTFRQVIEDKRRCLYDNHEQLVKSMLWDRKGRHKIESNDSATLPSKSKYYSQRRVNEAPKSVEDALTSLIPGLRMVERNPNGRVIKGMIDLACTKWTEMKLNLFKTDEMNKINKEYEEMEEQWSIIDVDKIRATTKNGL